MKNRGIFAIMAMALSGLLAKGKHLFEREPKHRSRKTVMTHGRGKSVRSRNRRAGSKLWHRLTVGHSACARLATRKTRRYALRGYGYIAPPEPKTKEVAA